MHWVRDFTFQDGHIPTTRNREDAPDGMRQELVDLIFGLSEHNPNAISDRHLHRVICQSLGVGAAGEPYGGYRYAAGRDLGRAEWTRVYDLISRLWPEFSRAGLAAEYREGTNRILSAHGTAWDVSAQGRLERVLPEPVHALIASAFVELSHPAAAPALELFRAAREAYDDRPRRDRDACSNIFDAMESVAKIKYQLPNHTFGQVKNHIEGSNLLAPEICAMLTGLNQLRNRHFGHGMAVGFSLSRAETDFVFLSCISAILLLTRSE